MIKTFRGLMTDGTQDTIVLHTNDGAIGYRIVKFQLSPSNPGVTAQESIMKIYKVSQTAPTMPGVTGTIDFSDNVLLAAAYIRGGGSYSWSEAIIFENEIFNQDIFVTHAEESASSAACNYYIELEQIKLDLSESTVATLKDIRNEKRIQLG